MSASRLHVSMAAVTPLFIGGAEPNERAELRAASLKGALRYWYRALDANCREDETRFFGSTTGGQSPCLVRLPNREGTIPWEQKRYEMPYDAQRDTGFQRGRGTQARNGIVYLGYTLGLRPNDRRALPHGTTFDAEFLARPSSDAEPTRRAWLGSLWLLVHVGGLGSRSRRGFGSVAVREWDGWEECDELPLACSARSPEEWKTRMEQAVRTLHDWFPRPQDVPPTHTVLAAGARMLLLREGHGAWERALDDAGFRLQEFRQRREPDYSTVKAHLVQRDAGRLIQPNPPGVTPAPLRRAPERAAFGLPLSFRYSSLPLRDTDTRGRPRLAEISFRGTTYDRLASPLFIRVIQLGQRYHGAFALLPSPGLPEGERVKDQRDREGRTSLPMPPEGRGVIAQFLDTAVAPHALEVAL